MISKIAVFISAFSDLSKALFLIPPAKISKFSPPPFSREAWVRRRFVVRVIEPWQTCFSAMQHQISRSQVIHLCIMVPLQRGLSRAYFTYDRDCDGRLRPSPFREGIGYLRPRRFAHCIDFITDQGRSGFPLRPCQLVKKVLRDFFDRAYPPSILKAFKILLRPKALMYQAFLRRFI